MSREQVLAAGRMRPAAIAAGHRHDSGKNPMVIIEVAA